MPRKPKRATPEVGAAPKGATDLKASAGTEGRAGTGGSAGTKGKPGAGGSTGSKASVGAKAGGGIKARASAKASGEAGSKAGARGTPGARPDLSRVEVEAIRQFALELARKGAGPDAVLICNPISEPSALPAKELLYDRCRWCETDIYYDRLMPSPPDLMRVCLKCGVLLLEAEKKGKN